jgi:isopentenyl-diphosphate Delta-isomerase
MDIESFSIVNSKDEHMLVIFGKENLHKNGGYHRAVHILIEVFGGLFVLQKKAKGTENAGKWSSAVSGHVRYNESYEEAAMREMEEELGLKIEKKDLHRIAKIKPSADNGNEFVVVFSYLMDPEEEVLKPDPKEVDEIVMGKLDDFIEDVESHMDEYSPAFVGAFNVFLVLEKGIEGANNE